MTREFMNKQPVIEVLEGERWVALNGHGCYSEDEAVDYVNNLDPQRRYMRVLSEVERDAPPPPEPVDATNAIMTGDVSFAGIDAVIKTLKGLKS